MLIVGLTGSFATGKTTVAKMFAKRGAVVLDADKIARRLIAPRGKCVKAVRRLFGGHLDRKKIAAVIFKDKTKRRRLEKIIHPAVGKELKRKISRYRKGRRPRVLILDVPLLIESGLDRLADLVIVVKANRRLQIKRGTKKFSITKQQAVQRMNAQMAITKKIRKADIVIDNRKNLTQTKKQVEAIWQRLITIKQAK